MNNLFQSYFRHHPGFYSEGNLVFQKDLVRCTEFEKNYLDLRKKEGRLYSDEEVQSLPDIIPASASAKEWTIRKHSANKLVAHVSQRKPCSILEIGCGNGWLLRHLSKRITADFCGLDINEWELQQAARISSNQNCFVYADIFSPSLNDLRTDVVILASSIQYFPDLDALIKRLLKLLNDSGEIHILDSPLYAGDVFSKAQQRSKEYFISQGADDMNQYYHHHSWQSLTPFNHQVLYNPRHFLNYLKTKIGTSSPFPWIRITRS